MKASKIAARLLSVVLAIMMILSLVTVGFTASAAEVETAETGADIPAGTVLYLKPNSNWTQSNAWFAAYIWNTSTNVNTWVKMEKVADTSATVYKFTVPSGTWSKIIFCRMNPGNTALNWNAKWDQSQDLVWSGSSVNCWAPAAGQWNNATGSWSYYNDPTLVVPAPATPAAPTVRFNNTFGGTGTAEDPYLVAPAAKTSMVVTGAIASDAKGLAYNVNYTATKVDWAEGANSVLYSDLTAPALDETATVNVYLWAYAGTGANKVYSEAYATTTVYIKGYVQEVDPELPTVPVVDNTYTLPYQKADGLYAYAGTEVAGTDAWQRWDEVSGTRYFYLPASASDTEVVILNTYSADVLLNGVIIPAGEYATVPYVDGTAYVCGGATTQTVKIMKSDAEGTLYINSADGMTSKNDKGEKGTHDAQFDLYAFMTSGSKNQETGKLAGAVADEDGVVEGTTVKKLKGRGNSTWNLAKKPFNITYDSTISVDGISKGKKWSLLANAQDSSLLRNRLVYDLANEVNMKYACDSRFVDWFVNGDYKGSYQLTQKIEMGKNTVMPDLDEPLVEVEEEGDVVPTENFDFILELDTATNADSSGDVYFKTNRGQVMTHKTPDEPTDEQVAFMKLKYQAVEDALYGDDMATLATLVDINDFARAYLVNEVAKNLDSGVTSCYFVYDSDAGIFYMSPVWDYDNALGNSVSIAERHDKNGKALDLTRPDGWYAKELMHYDTNFKGGRSVFAQAYAMTTKTADGKSFDDIVKAVWAADFADTAAILAGEAEAANGRLQSAEGYLGSLAESGQWNYSYGGWQLSNNTNNTWISNHNTLTMFSYNAEDNTYSTSTNKYDQTKFVDQATYAADWMLSRINWISAQYNEATEVAPEGFIKIYFENNWQWPDAKIHYWGGTTAAGTEWPGISMTYYDTVTNGDRYYIYVPADIEGIVFNGTGEYGAEQCADIKTGIADGNCYYMTYDSATNTKPAGVYKIEVVEPTDAPATDAPATDAPATDAPATDAPATDAPATDAPVTDAPVVEEYITVYFSNAWMWTDITCYFWGSAFEATPAWPGNAMTFVEKNDFGQDIYKATIPADATGMLFAGKDQGNDTKSPDITDIKDGYGYYMDWNEKDGTFVGMYEYVAPVVPSTEDEPASSEAADTTPVVTEPVVTEPASSEATEETVTIYLKVNNDWPAADAWFAAYYWNAAGEYGWATMTATEDAGIYAAEVPADTENLIFTRRNPAVQSTGWNKDGETKKIWNQTKDIVMTTDLTKNMFVLDAGWSDITGTWSVYDAAATTPTLPNVGEDTVIYFTNSNNWSKVNLYTWGGDNASKAWPGDAMTLVGKNAYGQDIYTAVIPAGTEGFLFNGMTKGDEGNKYQTVDGDLEKVVADAGFYPKEQVKTEGDADYDKWTLGSFTYVEGTATPDEEATADEVLFIADFNEWKGVEMTADESGKIYTISGIELKAGTYKFIINAFGKWLGNAGTIENLTSGEGWTFREEAGDCTLKTIGGVYTFTFNAETNKVTAYADIFYNVTFNEGNFTTTATETVKHGENLTFAIEAAEGFKVSAVIVDMKILEAVDGIYTIENVKNNINILVITSEVVTEPAAMQFTVTFTDKDGNVLDTQVVEYGQAATAPEAPVVDGYTFKAWDTAFDFVTKDITVKATYKKNVAPVAPATTGTLKIEIAGSNGFTIAVDGGAARPQGASYLNGKMPIGAVVTVTANANDAAEFYGWMDPITGAILSKELTYTFTASASDFIKATFFAQIEGVQKVTFLNDKAFSGAGRVLDFQYYAATDSITFPEDPTQVGYDFAGWNMTEAEIIAAIAAGEDVTVLATWTRQIVYVNVTVTGGTGAGKFNANSAVTVKADAAPAGQKFAYWVDGNGVIKSYSESYEFYPAADTDLTAVFVAEDAVIEYNILVSADSIDYAAQAAANKAVFVYSWYCPEQYTFVKAGILAVNKDNYKEESLFVGAGDSNVYDRSPDATNNIPANSYSWTKSNVTAGQTWLFKAYVQYRDANGVLQTVYSDIFEATKE